MSDEVEAPPAPGGWTFSNDKGTLVFSLTWVDGVVDVKLGTGMSYTKAAETFFDRLRGLS